MSDEEKIRWYAREVRTLENVAELFSAALKPLITGDGHTHGCHCGDPRCAARIAAEDAWTMWLMLTAQDFYHSMEGTP
jgi:hypothetical protein